MRSALVAVALWPLFAVAALAAEPPAAVETDFRRMTGALAASDYEAFVAGLGEEAKGRLTRERFDELFAPYITRFKGGFESAYLAQLRQEGCEVHVWKVIFRDGGDDFLIKLALEGGKVAGFRVH